MNPFHIFISMIDSDPLSILAAFGAAADPYIFPSIGETILVAGGIVFFLFLNAFFVASEFASVKVRRSQLMVEATEHPEHKRRVVAAQRVVEHLDTYLTANQVGITLASLALGFLGEPFVAKLLSPILHATGILDATTIKWISLIIAYASFTFFHVVFGELIPKSIAIRYPYATALHLSTWLHRFYISIYIVIAFFNGAANIILRKVFRIEPKDLQGHAHSTDELVFLVQESERVQEVTETEALISQNALELNELTVKDLMTPRSEVTVLDIQDSFEVNWEKACQTKHTRFPLVQGHLDSSIGLIHIKDMVRLINKENPDLLTIKRELKAVPETMPADTFLKFCLKEHTHLALVVDEFGDPTGLAFLDDVIEEIVGDIQDEFDGEEVSDFTSLGENEFVIPGFMTLSDLYDYVHDLNLESGGVSTIGGYVTQILEYIPEAGATLILNGYDVTVTGTDGRRIEQLHFKKRITDNSHQEN